MVAILGLVGIVVTAAVTAYLGRRSQSGSVETTEAKDLWDAMRGEMRRLQEEAHALRSELAVARQEIYVLREEIVELRKRLRELEADDE